MAHAYDKWLDVGDGCESYWLRITVDFQDDEGEPISKPYRVVALADEETGGLIALSREQVKELVSALQDALRTITS